MLRLLALLLAVALVFPAIAAAAPAPRQATEVLDAELARELERAGTNDRVPVLVEAATPGAGASDLDASARRARRAAEETEREGGAVRDTLSLVGAVAAELTPAQIRALARNPQIVRITRDAPVRATALPAFEGGATPVVYQAAVGAPEAWRQGWTGRGVGVAILDTGIAENPALGERVVEQVDLVTPKTPVEGDPGGHGTHLAGIIAANAVGYRGIAPEARLVSVRVLDANGEGRVSTVIRGLEWAIRHRKDENLRVVVMALSAPAQGSYRTDPLAAASEVAWRAGLVVVTAAGNGGPSGGTIASPGIDPLVLTVGAADDGGTAARADDSVPFFSSRGPTVDGLAKPDLVAPGRKIVSLRVPGSTLDRLAPDHREGRDGFRLTGTSMSTAVAAGAAAVLLQQRPSLDPDAVKALLTRSAHRLAGVDAAVQGHGELDLGAALATPTPPRRETRQTIRPADAFIRWVLPLLRGQELRVDGDRVQWDRVQWDRVQWDRVQWDRVQWDRVQWDRVQWDRVQWDRVQWDAASSGRSSWSGPLLD